MGLNFFSDAGSLFSMNALKDSWNNFKSKNQVSSSQLKFKELADYESVPDNELSLDGRYWKKKYNALAIIENDKDQKKSKYYKNMLNSLRKDLIYNKKMNSYTMN